jgi:hypothetical protein
MRASPGTYRFTFTLPRELVPAIPRGRHQPCLEGCVLTITGKFLVAIEGPSRERVFDQARRFLRIVCKDGPAVSLPATLETPLRDRFQRPIPGRDSWSIIINAQIAFSPGSLPPDLLDEQESTEQRRDRFG